MLTIPIPANPKRVERNDIIQQMKLGRRTSELWAGDNRNRIDIDFPSRIKTSSNSRMRTGPGEIKCLHNPIMLSVIYTLSFVA